MALKPCRECKRKVSTESKVCPRCGVPEPTLATKKNKSKKISGKTGKGGWPKEYLEAQANLMTSYDEKKGYKDPSEWDEYYGEKNKREAAEKRIIDKHFGGRSASNNKRDASPKGDGFWNGTEGLAKTFWLYFIGGNAVGNLLALLAESEGSGMVMFVIVIIIAWNIFAIMGVFNAADIYKNQMIKAGQTYGYATAAKVAVVLLILSSIGNAL